MIVTMSDTDRANMQALVRELDNLGYIAESEGTTVAFTYDTGYDDLGPMMTAKVDFGTRTARVRMSYNSPHVLGGSAVVRFSHTDTLARSLVDLYEQEI